MIGSEQLHGAIREEGEITKQRAKDLREKKVEGENRRLLPSRRGEIGKREGSKRGCHVGLGVEGFRCLAKERVLGIVKNKKGKHWKRG